MSALPMKADVCDANRQVCFGPEADIALFDHLISAGKQRRGNFKSERLRSLEVDC
jgi:hypothetical protein